MLEIIYACTHLSKAMVAVHSHYGHLWTIDTCMCGCRARRSYCLSADNTVVRVKSVIYFLMFSGCLNMPH